MPYAVTHVLVPILIISLIHHLFLSSKSSKFSPHYIFIAAIGGVLPDIDIVISIFLKILGLSDWWLHKTFTHSIFFPTIILLLALILIPISPRFRICLDKKHNLSLSVAMFIIALGSFIHLILDTISGNQSYLFYPFSLHDYGLNLFSSFGIESEIFGAIIDGAVLVIWLTYLEARHKIGNLI